MITYDMWKQLNERVNDGQWAKPEAPRGKLCLEQAKEIMKLKYEMKAEEVAKIYGVSKVAVRYIWIGKTWKDVA